MTATMTTTNGRARKTLAEQIDRLDGILDGLADALNQAIAQAVREAVTVAVRAAVTEALANPELRQRLAPVAQATPPQSPIKRLLAATRRACGRAAAAAGRFVRWLGGMIRRLPGTTRRLVASGVRGLATGARRLPGLMWRMRGPVLLALSVGSAVAWGCYVAGPLIASACGGLLGAAQALSGRARRLQSRPVTSIRGAKP
jgi:hypothetical protein